jgi:hypothetical protein
MTKHKLKEIKISEVLHLAADEYIAVSIDNEKFNGPYQYSCTAIRKALRIMVDKTSNADYNFYLSRITTGLHRLGFTDFGGIGVFQEFEYFSEPTEASQGARYLWLKFCALMAEEQGE